MKQKRIRAPKRGTPSATTQKIIDHLLRLRSRLKDIQEAGIDLTETCYHWALDNSFHILELARQGLRGRTLGGALAEIELDAVLKPYVDAGYSRHDDPLTAPITVDPVNGYDPAEVTAQLERHFGGWTTAKPFEKYRECRST